MPRIIFSFVLFALSPVAWSQTPSFPKPFNSERETNATPMAAAAAAASVQMPPGFKTTLFAAEPDVQNPIAIAWDARGRLWVAENYTYAEREKRFELGLHDRVLIFEDTNGDGYFDKRTVFIDDVQMLTSIEVGRGGVWLMCPPQLLFIPDRNGDDKPDGPAEVMLDGFTVSQENYHNFANGLRFGPDGWLYGRCGGACPGELGVPGTPPAERIPLRSTMWRYHPQRKVVEVLGSGTTNPWGHDWDEHGELFFVNSVNGHLWHGITGAHFHRKHTLDPNPRVYELIDQHADHWHYNNSDPNAWTGGGGAANAYGGGHAHVGMMFYQGDNWPAEYRNHLFTLNFYGRRANQDIIERQGSGYFGRHGKDVFLIEDPFFRGIDLSYGPDGGVLIIDWSDTGECHENTGVHRESGRIFKVVYGQPKRIKPFDLTKLSPSELVKLHTHANEWYVRQARLQLAELAANRRDLSDAGNALRKLFEQQKDPVLKLRALWSLYVIGQADEKFLQAQLQNPNEHIRVWVVRLLTDSWPLDTVLSQRPSGSASSQPNATTLTALIRLSREDSSGIVRLTLASALQRLPVAQRAKLATELVAHAEDAADHNLPLMVWYGLIPVGDSDPTTLAKLTGGCEWPKTRKFAARRLAEDIEKNPGPVNDLIQLAAAKPEAFQADILAGLSDGLAGWRKARKPSAWDALAGSLANSTNQVVRNQLRNLNILFGDGLALDEVKRIVLDGAAPLKARQAALLTLIEARSPDLRQICEKMLHVTFLNGIAARGLALFDDPTIGTTLAQTYRSFHPSDRATVMDTLVSRPAFAAALLTEVSAGRISRSDVTAFHARQIRSFNDPALNEQLAKSWGELRESAADKQALIKTMKEKFTPAVLTKADKSAGRATFTAACAVCHRLYGQGGEIGPDLTGSGRDNLDYLLENIIDPSAVVNADFHMSVIDLKDDRTLNAQIIAQTDRTITLRTLTETLTLERSEIAAIRPSTLSIMPEGLVEGLSETQVRDLLAYLMARQQVPLPAGSEKVDEKR